jgi:hypothetical protein
VPIEGFGDRHGQEFVPWPEKDGYWALVPVVEAVAQ